MFRLLALLLFVILPVGFSAGCSHHHHHHFSTTTIRVSETWAGPGHGHCEHGRDTKHGIASFDFTDHQTYMDTRPHGAYTDLVVTNLTTHHVSLCFEVSGDGWHYCNEVNLAPGAHAGFDKITTAFWALSEVKVSVHDCPVENG
jgi:hypothetical protein